MRVKGNVLGVGLLVAAGADAIGADDLAADVGMADLDVLQVQVGALAAGAERLHQIAIAQTHPVGLAVELPGDDGGDDQRAKDEKPRASHSRL